MTIRQTVWRSKLLKRIYKTFDFFEKVSRQNKYCHKMEVKLNLILGIVYKFRIRYHILGTLYIYNMRTKIHILYM